MQLRTFKNGYAISTFPCNKGYATALYGKYGNQLQLRYAKSEIKAKRNHNELIASISQEVKGNETICIYGIIATETEEIQQTQVYKSVDLFLWKGKGKSNG